MREPAAVERETADPESRVTRGSAHPDRIIVAAAPAIGAAVLTQDLRIIESGLVATV